MDFQPMFIGKMPMPRRPMPVNRSGGACRGTIARKGAFSAEGIAQSGAQSFRRFALYDITHRAGFGRALRILGFFVRRENQDDEVGEFAPQLFCQLETVRFAGQLDIKDDAIRLQLADHFDPLIGTAGFVTNDEFIADTEQPFQTFPKQGVVIDENNPLRRVAGHAGAN
jgi:hypothetical protein